MLRWTLGHMCLFQWRFPWGIRVVLLSSAWNNPFPMFSANLMAIHFIFIPQLLKFLLYVSQNTHPQEWKATFQIHGSSFSVPPCYHWCWFRLLSLVWSILPWLKDLNWDLSEESSLTPIKKEHVKTYLKRKEDPERWHYISLAINIPPPPPHNGRRKW